MSEPLAAVRVDDQGPGYVSWRAELLAELALAWVPELTVYRRPAPVKSGPGQEFLVSTPEGVCFFVVVKGYSSFHLDLKAVASCGTLQWVLNADEVRNARQSRSPVVLFLFDADTEHGRFLRLDTLPDPERGVDHQVLRFPAENTITPEALRRLAAGLRLAQPA